MKNRRNIIVAFLLCACLLVGIGYANLTTNLQIKGTAKIDGELAETKFDADIVWASSVVSAQMEGSAETYSTTKVSSVIDSSNDNITITADGLDNLNETITVVSTMVNNSADTGAWVSIPTYNSAGDASTYITTTRVQEGYTSEGAATTTVIQSSQGTTHNERFYLAPNGGTATVTITFRLTKSFVPTDTLVEVSSTFTLDFVVEAIDNT